MPERAQIVQREREWGLRCGLAAILGAILGFAGFILLQAALKGEANFEGLREAHEHSSTVWLSGIATGVGYLLLAPPLLFLFKAIQARSERVRGQLLGLVLLGPLLLGIAGIVLAGGTQEAANTYVEGNSSPTASAVKEAPQECREELKDKGKEQFAEDFPAKAGGTALQACEAKKVEESKASEAIKDSSLVGFAQWAGLAGGLALVISLFYCGLWAMRTGLLSRFWGSLGMAVGVAAVIGLSPFVLVWFLYLGLLLIGKVPGGKPPAWDAGEAIPWPSPGEKAAEELQPTDPDAIDVDSTTVPGSPPEERRKRKQRGSNPEGESE
jgi:hypothetical protein